LPEGFGSLGSIVFVKTVFDADTGFGMRSGTRFGRDAAFASPAIQLGEIPGRRDLSPERLRALDLCRSTLKVARLSEQLRSREASQGRAEEERRLAVRLCGSLREEPRGFLAPAVGPSERAAGERPLRAQRPGSVAVLEDRPCPPGEGRSVTESVRGDDGRTADDAEVPDPDRDRFLEARVRPLADSDSSSTCSAR